jgi:hypothetical protein
MQKSVLVASREARCQPGATQGPLGCLRWPIDLAIAATRRSSFDPESRGLQLGSRPLLFFSSHHALLAAQCLYDLVTGIALKQYRGLLMKIVFAAAVIAMLAVPAYAQGLAKGAGPQPSSQAPKSQQEIEADRAAERAYKKSLGNIPDQPPADPWGSARSIDAPKAAAKTPAAKKSPAKTGSTAN